jgi:seryl-tRNA synthetase
MELLSTFINLFTNSSSYKKEKHQQTKSETLDSMLTTSEEHVLYNQRIGELQRVQKEIYKGIQKQSAVSQGEFTAYGEEAIGGELL